MITHTLLPLLPQGPNLVIHHPEAVIESMNDWCKEHHGKSGLTQRVRESEVTMQQAEAQVGARSPRARCRRRAAFCAAFGRRGGDCLASGAARSPPSVTQLLTMHISMPP